MFFGTVIGISLFMPEESLEVSLIAAALLNGQFVDGIIQHGDEFQVLRGD
jgi:hypothetical protein